MPRDYSGIAQLVEHLTVNQVVDGSSPPAGVMLNYLAKYAGLAQLVEHRYRKPRVGDSNSSAGIRKKRKPSGLRFLLPFKKLF